MENITIGQISTFLAFLVGVLGSMKYLSAELKKQVNKTLKPINDSIKELDVSQCKNYLVRYLKDLEQGNALDEVEIERAYEIYDHYTNDLKQNSYIHKRWEELEDKNERKNK
jgi:hypothetical protein